MKLICTVILNYNNYDDTKECIDSIIRMQFSSDYTNKIVLIDNCSTDESGERLYHLYGEKIVYLKSDFNCGYAAGNNIGIRYSVEQGANYICVLNNDTVAFENCILPCVEYLEEYPNTGFIGPLIENYDDAMVQSTGGDIFWRKGSIIVKNQGVSKGNLPKEIESDYIGGACLIFRSNLIEKIGFIPEDYFLFFEETEWCWKAKKNGMRNVCLTSVSIRHKGSASIDAISGLHAYLMERNRVIFLRKNAPDFITYIRAIMFLIIKYIKKGIFENKEYFNYLKYMRDGLNNTVDSKYPFIYTGIKK